MACLIFGIKKSNEIFVHGILALYVGVFIISGFLDMKAFIYVYTGKQSKALTAVINVLQILLFIYFFFVKLLSSEYFIFYFYFSSNVYPVNKPLFPPALMEFYLTISAMVKGLLQ